MKEKAPKIDTKKLDINEFIANKKFVSDKKVIRLTKAILKEYKTVIKNLAKR